MQSIFGIDSSFNMRRLLWTLLWLCTYSVGAQVKVGDDIDSIDPTSILELQSSDKVFVPTRMTAAEMNTLTPLHGAIVYNTDARCLFLFEGILWKSLCNSEISVTTAALPPSNPASGDIWFNTTDNLVNLWDGTVWTPIPSAILRGNGIPNSSTAPNPVGGMLYVDRGTGNLYSYDGTIWILQTLTATNGLTKTNGGIELGGTLSRATEITMNPGHTLAIIGLEEDDSPLNPIVRMEESTGILRKSSISSIVQQEEIVIVANANQNQFNPPLTISDAKKLNVYRNGIKLGFTVLNDTTIELETPVVCYQNDEIRIVQFY